MTASLQATAPPAKTEHNGTTASDPEPILNTTDASTTVQKNGPKEDNSARATSEATAQQDAGDSCAYDPAANFSGDVLTNDELPSKADMEKVAEHPVLSVDGSSRPFKSLYEDEDGQETRHFLIFVRHFFCGHCIRYLEALSSRITPEMLANTTPPSKISVIGCGSPEKIPDYANATRCPFPIYTDPTYNLYNDLGMIRTLDMGKKRPVYQKASTIGLIMKDTLHAAMSPVAAVKKGGDWSQVGGEFLFSNGKVVWCHRMRNTRDHSEIEDVAKLLGVNL